jgi:hypothetical protein
LEHLLLLLLVAAVDTARHCQRGTAYGSDVRLAMHVRSLRPLAAASNAHVAAPGTPQHLLDRFAEDVPAAKLEALSDAASTAATAAASKEGKGAVSAASEVKETKEVKDGKGEGAATSTAAPGPSDGKREGKSAEGREVKTQSSGDGDSSGAAELAEKKKKESAEDFPDTVDHYEKHLRPQ